MRIFNHKSLDLDESDVDFLTNGQVLYVSESKIQHKFKIKILITWITWMNMNLSKILNQEVMELFF